MPALPETLGLQTVLAEEVLTCGGELLSKRFEEALVGVLVSGLPRQREAKASMYLHSVSIYGQNLPVGTK